jgi:cytochrome c553
LKTHTSLASGVTAAIVLLGAVSNASGQKLWNAPRVVTNNCSGCHGIDGNAQLSYFPRLAGIDAAYAEKKMTMFREQPSPPVDDLFFYLLAKPAAREEANTVNREARLNMIGIAHAATPEEIKQAAFWYAKQTPMHGRSASGALVEQGKNIFVNGVPAERVLACKTCHGAEAQGMGPAPRLAGQNGEYTWSQLERFRRGDRRHAPEMTTETRDLDASQARAAAAYLQTR